MGYYAGFGTTLSDLLAIPASRRTDVQVATIRQLQEAERLKMYGDAALKAATVAEDLKTMSPAEKLARRLAFLESTGQTGSEEAQGIREKISQAAASGDPDAQKAKEDIATSDATGQPLLDVIAKKGSGKVPLIIGGVTVAAILAAVLLRRKRKKS